MVVSVRVPESGVCLHISGEDSVWYRYDVLYAVLYVRVSCFVVRGCAVSRRYINVRNCDMLLMYTLTIYICVLCIDVR